MATSTRTIEERERLAVLRASGALDKGSDPSYEFLAQLASDRLGMPMAAITVMTADEIVALAVVGTDFGSFPRDDALTWHMLDNPGPVAVGDASAAEPLASSAIVTTFGVRAYCGVPLVTDDGHVLGAISVADTTVHDLGAEEVDVLTHLADQVVANMERRRIENELALTVQRLEHGERLALVGSWEWKPASGWVTWSNGTYMLFGFDRNVRPSYEAFLELVHPDDRDRVDRVVTAAAMDAETFDYRCRIVRPDGTVRRVEAHGEADVLPGGEMVMRGAIKDVTDQHSAASDLRMQTALLDRVESAAVVGLDIEGHITHWNQGAEILYGWKAAEVRGRQVFDLDLFASGANPWRDGGAALRDLRSWKGEAEIRCKDQSTLPAFVTASAVTDDEDRVVGYVGVLVDLTGTKRAEADLRQSRAETIHRLSRAVEMRDMDTGGHIIRIAEYAAEIARRLGLDGERVELIRVASPMHDVGKLGISDDILRKTGALDPGEVREMRRHTTIGYEILSGTGADVLEMAATIALTHHEWFDGTGYPRELAGEKIPLEGRIVAVADVYDALTSDRVYRKAFSHDEALEMMRSERGTHFDPQALDAMLEILGQ